MGRVRRRPDRRHHPPPWPDRRHPRPPWPDRLRPPQWSALRRLRQWRGRPRRHSVLPRRSIRPWHRVQRRVSPHRRARPLRILRRPDPRSIVARLRFRNVPPWQGRRRPRSPHPRARAHRPRPARGHRGRIRSQRARKSVSSASSSDSKLSRSGSARCFRATAQSGRAASIACKSECSNCSRKSRKASGRNARRNGCCRRRTACSSVSSACSKVIRRAFSGWHHALRLNHPPLQPPRGPQPAGGLPRTSAAMTPCKPEPR